MRYIPSIQKLLIVFGCLVACACATPAGKIASLDPDSLYDQAVSKESSGNVRDACRSYLSLWRSYPDDKLAPKALYRAAAITAIKDPRSAADLYRAFLTAYPDSPLKIQAEQELLDTQIRIGDHVEAYGLFKSIYAKNPDPKLVRTGVRIIKGLGSQGRYPEVFDLTCMIFPNADKPSQETVIPFWKTAVEGTDDVEVLENLETRIRDNRLLMIILAREARLYLDEGNRDTARRILSQLGTQDSPLSPAEQASLGSNSTVGVLLPLSGKWESVARKVLKGIEFSSGVFRSNASSQVEYLIRDYGDNDQSIPGIIEELDKNNNIVALIGPIGEGAGSIACREVQRRGIPSMIFTRAESAPDHTSYCFSNFVSIDVQAEALLKAASGMNISRFAVLYPADQFGKTFAGTFSRKAKAYGIQVVRQAEYATDLAGVKNSIRKLKSAPKPGTGKSQAAAGTGFQALLIPDDATNSAMIASYLPYYNVRGVRLFGPALWDSPELVRVGGDNVEDAVFVSGFYAASQLRNVRDFIQGFYSTFGHNPSIWEATAYDTSAILQELLAVGSPSRQSLQEKLGSIRDYQGLTGTTSFQKNGTVEKNIYVLTVRNSSIVEITP